LCNICFLVRRDTTLEKSNEKTGIRVPGIGNFVLYDASMIVETLSHTQRKRARRQCKAIRCTLHNV
jgi:hypothetical protein